MKKGIIALIAAFLVVILSVVWAIGQNNSLVTLDEGVNAQWSNVENQYQRRADLIPNLVATVKGYASHESSTLEAVIAARARATQVTVDPTKMDAQSMEKYQTAQGELSQALGRLLMVSENYPDLKANENFKELQTQLERTENRITTERGRFNEMAKDYNTKLRRFPTSMVASMMGFEKKSYFEAQDGAEQAPKVEF